MNTPIAITLGVFIIGGLCLDAFYYDWDYTLFLLKKFAEFLEWIAFWR